MIPGVWVHFAWRYTLGDRHAVHNKDRQLVLKPMNSSVPNMLSDVRFDVHSAAAQESMRAMFSLFAARIVIGFSSNGCQRTSITVSKRRQHAAASHPLTTHNTLLTP